jgi:hypothetical protein
MSDSGLLSQPKVTVAADAAGSVAGIRYRVQGIRRKRMNLKYRVLRPVPSPVEATEV